MPDVVGIRFKPCGKTYDFDAEGTDVKQGDSVIVESDFGLSIGRVVKERRVVEPSDRQFKKIVRIVNENDLRTKNENTRIEKEARDYCLERIIARGLPMKLIGAESTLDRKRVIFYFTADGRIDFRELVKDLAAKFKTRIEMRQIGVRDEAKLIGGLGICGRTLCCSTFLTSFEPVSIRMAKRQDLALNVGKLSGLCSRLMCCLRYEYEGNLAAITKDDELPPDKGDTEKDPGVELISQVLSKLEDNGVDEEPRKKSGPGNASAPQRDARNTRGFTSKPSSENEANKQAPSEQKDKPQGERNNTRRRRFRK